MQASLFGSDNGRQAPPSYHVPPSTHFTVISDNVLALVDASKGRAKQRLAGLNVCGRAKALQHQVRAYPGLLACCLQEARTTALLVTSGGCIVAGNGEVSQGCDGCE
eukprot:6636664-Alexandrium_andersonii.AAC.1